MLVQRFLEHTAERHPDKTALVCDHREVCYADLDAMADRFANALTQDGTVRGDRVIVFLENSVECVACIFGIVKAGAVIVPVNPGTKVRKLRHIIDDCLPKALVTDNTRVAIALAAMCPEQRTTRIWISSYSQQLQNNSANSRLNLDKLLIDGDTAPCSPFAVGVDVDLAALIYTSGSSAMPKGVMLSHLNIISAAHSISTYLECRHDDVVLNVLPLAFDYGLYQVFLAFDVGATLVLQASFTYAGSIIRLLMERRITGFPLVPTIAAMILQLKLREYSFPALRYITSTGDALPVSHIQALRNVFPGVKLYSMYGLTECKRVSYLPPEQLDIHPGSVGRGMTNQDVYIVDECGRRVGPRVTGELVVRGSHIMRGYWNLPEETDRVLRPGPFLGERVLYTGDLFWMDELGYLYFVGRRDAVIKSRGQQVSPQEVEAVITGMEPVAEAAVFGLPDAIVGSTINAIVVPKPGRTLSETAVRKHCALHLEPHAVPHTVHFAARIPRNDRGKVERRALAQALGAHA